MEKNEEKIKTSLAIAAKASNETPTAEGQHIGMEILDEIQEIKETQKQIINFLKY